ncbi:MAG: DNA-processing protein DprA [Comamonas sp.]
MVNTVSEPSHQGDVLDAETAAWLRLLLTPGVGRSTARRLLARAGSAEAIWQLPHASWGECANSAQVQALAVPPADWAQQCTATAQWLNSAAPGLGHTLITLGHPQYPDCLLQSEDPPLLLFVQGSATLLQSDDPWFPYPATLAVVGSRNPSAQGLVNARQMAQALAESGLCIVSGLARGIDAAAHEGALLAGQKASRPRTIAVVGTGLDQVYPSSHSALARQIAEHGLVVSEYLLGSGPLARHFPQRNRIIAGLSQGTLVVEAALQSGSLITARLASEQGREVFAIPGSIHAPQSKGCHALLRQGAKLVETAQDVLEEFQGFNTPPARNIKAHAAIKKEATAEHPLLAALGHEPMSLDALAARTGWDAAHLQAQLMELELDNRVARLPGGMYQRLTAT